ncbi:selenocysteine lyase-like [Periplaneta americana]|uniref:selenocysteine lyase-like n=1 Tax=Periplaneta americana TaxID=6978 RepID=UPI0037E8A9C4
MEIYLDYNATTPLEPSVISKISQSMEELWGNPSSSYGFGIRAKRNIEEARKQLADMIGAVPEDIIFTSGGTEANNIVIFGILNYYDEWLKCNPESEHYGKKPHIITTNIEHPAVILPLRYLAEKKAAIELSIVPVNTTGSVDPRDILCAVRPNTSLITVMLANNETGVILPVAEISRGLEEINLKRREENKIKILYHTDAAQAIGKISVHAPTLQVDYLTIVGHKFYGPRIGCLYARGLMHQDVPLYPVMFGGGQERGYRPGTENTPMIVGLGEAARLVCENLTTYNSHMETIRDYLEKKLKEAFGEDRVVFNCSKDVQRLPNTCNVSLVGEGFVGHVVLSKATNVYASVGAACHAQNKPSEILLASGVSCELAVNALRLSVGRSTTREDIDNAVKDLKQAADQVLNGKHE